MKEKNGFPGKVRDIYYSMMAALAFQTIAQPIIGPHPLVPIFGIIGLSCSFLLSKRVKHLAETLYKKIGHRPKFREFPKRARMIILMTLIVPASILTYGFVRLMIPPNIAITNLQDGDKVPWKYTIKGSSSFEIFASRVWPEGFLGQRLYVYVIVFCLDTDGPWWVQGYAIIQPNGDWEVYSNFGRDPNMYPVDIGAQYRVYAIITREKLQQNQTFYDLPNYLGISKSYSVTRK